MIFSARWLLLCCLWLNFVSVASALPSEFSMEPSLSAGGGVELVWSPSKKDSSPLLRIIGNARPEFRLSGRLLGYPREDNGQLRLLISSKDRDVLIAIEGESLQVWSAGRRLDGDSLRLLIENKQGVNVSTVPAARTPTTSLNPAKNGRFWINRRRLEYSLSTLPLDEFPAPIEVMAEVTDASAAPGKRPLVLFIHGWHATCYEYYYSFRYGWTYRTTYAWPCPNDYKTYPSYKGYRYIADVLASQGYIVVSISANGINAQASRSNDQGASSRSQLIHHHLKLWAKWNTEGGDPWNNKFLGRLDMNKVVLVGHGLGGEGSHIAAIDATPSDPYKIVGIFSFGPTASGRQVTPDVHSATMLPTCSGGAFGLEGQTYIDASRDIAYSEALRSAVIAVGCNHNYFNTEWTPGVAKGPAWDDWINPINPFCGPNGSLRLSASEQRAVGVAYTTAFVKLVTDNDNTMLPFLDGTNIRPEAIGKAEVVTSAVGGARHRYLYIPQTAGEPILDQGMQGNECFGPGGFTIDNMAAPICGDGEYWSPHWAASFSLQSSCQAMELQWIGIGATSQFSVVSSQSDCSDLDWIDVRIANEPDQDSVNFDLKVLDGSGSSATLASNFTTVSSWPGSNPVDRPVLARTLRYSLASVRSLVDLTDIQAVILVAKSAAGRVWILDIAASQAKVATPTTLNLPKLSFESVVALETDGVQTYTMDIVTDQPLEAPGSIWVVDMNERSGVIINLIPSSSTVVAQVSVERTGDDISTGGLFENEFKMVALEGVVIGNYSGFFVIREDEALPVLSVVSADVVALEGESFEWTFTLSAPTPRSMVFHVDKPRIGRTELTTEDIDEEWLKNQTTWFGTLPLSTLNLYLDVYFKNGTTTATLSIPVVNDGLAEGDEFIALSLSYYFGAPNIPELQLTGRVLAH